MFLSYLQLKVLKFDEELSRLSLGKLTENPWDNVNENIKINIRIQSISMNENNVSNNKQFIWWNYILNELVKTHYPSKIVNLNDEIEVITDITKMKKN